MQNTTHRVKHSDNLAGGLPRSASKMHGLRKDRSHKSFVLYSLYACDLNVNIISI